jgi:hypothetical protein
MDSQPCVQAPYSAPKLVDFLLSYRKSAMGLLNCPSPAPRMEVQASGDVNNNNNAKDHQAELLDSKIPLHIPYTTYQSLTNGRERFCFRPPVLRIRDILVRIRIRESVPLFSSGSGSLLFFFVRDLQDGHYK